MTQLHAEHRGDWRWRMVIPVLLALVAVIGSGFLIERQSQQVAAAQLRADVSAQLSVIRAKLEGNVAANVQLVKGLVSVIATEPDMDQARYEALVSGLFIADSQLIAIAAAPDLIIRMTYPFEANKASIGLDYRQNPAQWSAVRSVVDSGELHIAGPVDLVQGGRGFIGRFPVYSGEGDIRRLWGIVSAVIDIDQLYAESGLNHSGLVVSITGVDGIGSSGERFYGPDLGDRSPVITRVMLPSGSWQIAAVPQSGWAPDPTATWAMRAIIIVASVLILFPVALTGRMVGERHSHIRTLNEREIELTRLSRRLNLALTASKIGVWELNLQTREQSWDERTSEIYGLPADASAQNFEQWRALIHPSDIAKVDAGIESSARHGTFEADYRIVLRGGRVRHIRAIGVPVNEPGQPAQIIGVNWDITADVALTENLRQANLSAKARNADLEAARNRIEHNALHDSLTGLPNRRYLDEMLQSHAADGYHGSGSIALLHIDLDRFKQINDTLGHAAGDAMLVHASQVLRANSRETDFVARIGGDEFVIVSSAGSSDDRLGTMAERIVGEMRKPVRYEGHECRFGVSIGLAVQRRADIDVKQLLINADIALYRAKARGRSRHEYFSEALQAEVVHTKRVADDILKSLDSNAFVPHYQPQFCAQSLDLVGVEALVRWQHPSQGLLTPDRFLAIAEELNVMAQIDGLVLDQALADLTRWDGLGLQVPRVSVNVSLRRLNDESLIESLKSLTLPTGRVAFELVESIYLDEGDSVVAWNIDQIKDLGIDVEIDDFGTGYASIVSLQKLRPRRLKIDRQLVMPILAEPAQRQLVASIVDIGKSMDIEIVAEGVETFEHAAILRDLGCDILQGYAFAKPMSRDDFEAFVSGQTWRQAG